VWKFLYFALSLLLQFSFIEKNEMKILSAVCGEKVDVCKMKLVKLDVLDIFEMIILLQRLIIDIYGHL
jgi:hypothetical protein